ncbi:MAG: GAF domain-containing protein [bacterium]|nr:GAF domain-containing protein [bacterium]
MKDSVTHRILRRSLTELLIGIGAGRLELFAADESDAPESLPILRIGAGRTEDCAAVTDLPFAGFVLRVHSPETLAPDATNEIRVHRRLAGILLRGVYVAESEADPNAEGQARIRSGFLAETLLELLHLLDERDRKIANYVRIIELNDKILAADQLYDVLQLVMELAKVAVGGDDAALLLVDPRTGEMTFKVVAESFEGHNRKLEQIRIPSGQGIAGSVVLSARAEIIRDVGTDPRSFQKVDRILGQTTRDMVVAPIVARGRVIGVIEVINSRAQTGFLSEHLEMLEHIASHASLFIENVRGREQLTRASQDLDRRSSEAQVLAELTELLSIRQKGEAAPGEADSLRHRFLRTLVNGLRLPAAALLKVSADQKALNEIAHFQTGGKAPTAFPADGAEPVEPAWREVSDILLWLTQNNEPFRFGQFGDDESGSDFAGSAPGLENRFRAANAGALGDPARAPGIWLPVFSDDRRHIKLLISFSGLRIAPPEAPTELVFFRTVMNLTRAIFTLDA